MDLSQSGKSEREGNNGGRNLPNIVEERSDELFLSDSIRINSGAFYTPQQQQSDEMSLPTPELELTADQANRRQRHSLGEYTTYSVPLSSGDSPKGNVRRTRSLRPSWTLSKSDKSSDVNRSEKDPTIMKQASTPRLPSFQSGSAVSHRHSVNTSQFSRNDPSFSSKSTQSLRKSLSLGQPSSYSGSSGTGFTGSSGGFTSNLSRKSQNFRSSIARRGGDALARLTRYSSMESELVDSLAGAHKNAVYRYTIGDPVLISNQNARMTNCVNRLGFPPGTGSTSEEQRGPYIYVLGTVKTVHYEENAVFYTVTRVDTGWDLRGDPDSMEPILNKAGEEAARKAATESAMATSLEDEGEDDDVHAPPEVNEGAIKVVENILEVLLLPFFLLYDLFVFVLGARLFRWAEKVAAFAKRQARAFLNGLSPYECSASVTTVNMIVLCSIWYMFIDQARLAFFPTEADDSLAVINFIVWLALVLELAFGIFIRPDGYSSLIQSDKAYTPMTARYLSRVHLIVETISLIFFVPEFLCLFQPDLECDDRPKFSFSYSAILAITGPTRLKSFAGRLFYGCIRLRVFGLVRHWRNMWLNKKYLKRDKQKELERKVLRAYKETSTKSQEEADTHQGTKGPNLQRLEQKQRNAALINASNIGTALMVTNSYRAMVVLVLIIGVLPMITLIYLNGVVNSVTNSMVAHLQITNMMVTVENESNCDFLVDTVASWTSTWYSSNKPLITSPTDEFLIAVVIQPARCREKFDALTVGDVVFSQSACPEWQSQEQPDLVGTASSECIVGVLGGFNSDDWQSIARNLDLRLGNIQMEFSESSTRIMRLEDGSSFETPFQVSAGFNQTNALEISALASLILQLCLLIMVLGGLNILRLDSKELVLGPLRNMLKIVARYAKNPLAQTATSSKDNQSIFSDSESEASTRASDGEGSEDDGIGTYETEQLITAVTKITDLLRKCWGVAGADIISTNLASREGALAEVFNPTVPGKSVYALFAFAAINGFDHALKCLGGDVMILINDVARVLHDEVYRWGFGDSGECNKNLGAAFLMVFRIGLVKEVVEKLEEATKVVFSTSDPKKSVKKKNKASPAHIRSTSDGNKMNSWLRASNMRSLTQQSHGKGSNAFEDDGRPDAMQLSLQSLPGISTFTDRAVIGMLKAFAGIHRDYKLRAWSRDFRLSAGVGAFEVNMIFGMDAGWAVEGAVGSEYKIDATYLSPHVNMASRMMSACKHYGVTLLLSESVQELMSETAKSKLRNVDRVTVKGSVRIQKIFTFDARHKGADFFLFSRSDDLADIDAEQYVPSIWTTDQDLQAMRHHVTDDFESEFNAGMKAYYAGDWPAAIRKLENANEIMVEAAMEEGYLHDEMDNTPDRKELYRAETADGPCSYLVNFMKSKGGVAPEGWAGWHPLLSK